MADITTENTLRQADIHICGHGIASSESLIWHTPKTFENLERLFYVKSISGSGSAEIDGHHYELRDNLLLLAPSTKSVTMRIENNTEIELHWCSFSAELSDGRRLFNFIRCREWASTPENSEKTERSFRRFHMTYGDNILIDVLEKRIMLLMLLLDMFRDTCPVFDFNLKQYKLDFNKLRTYIERKNIDERITEEEMGKLLNVHPYYLSREFKKEFGITPSQYVRDVRIGKMCLALSETDHPIAEIAASFGFAEYNYFSNFFKRQTGMTPTEYRKKSREEKNDTLV